MRIRACIYLRKSTHQQASIEAQRNQCWKYAKRHGYQVVEEHKDEGISGHDYAEKRPGFVRLVKAAQRGEFETLIALDMSRITRSDPMLMMAELLPLREAGVQIATTDREDLREWNFTTFLTDGIEGENNYAESRKKSRRVTIVQLELACRGGWIAGTPPLGLSTVGEPCPGIAKSGIIKRLVISDDKEAVAAVRWMFKAYASGLSLFEVRDGMEQKGFKITKESVRNMLQNPLYVGDYAWNRRTEAKFYTVRGGDVVDRGGIKGFRKGPNDRRDWIFIRDNHPALIDRQLFNKIQRAFERRKMTTTPNRGGYALTGLCRCSQCGRTMVCYVDKRTKSKPIVWRCGGYASGQGCRANPVKESDLLAAIARSIRSWFENPKMIEKLRAEAGRQLKQRTKSVDVSDLRRQRKSAARKLANLESRLLEVSRDMIPRVEAGIRETEERIEQYDRDIAAVTTDIETALDQYAVTADTILERLRRIEELMRKARPKLVREYLSQMIESITVEVRREPWGRTRFKYHLSGGQITMKKIKPDCVSLPSVC